MISKMKKLTFLVFYKEYEQFLNDIRELGVVHVSTQQAGASENEELQENLRKNARYTATLKILKRLLKKDSVESKNEVSIERGEACLDKVDALLAEKNRLGQLKQSLEKEISSMEAWGDFDTAAIKKLQGAGYNISFFTCPEKNFMKAWEDEYHTIEINQIGSRLYFVTVTKTGESINIDAENVKMPELSLSALKTKLEETTVAFDKTDEDLEHLAATDIASVEYALSALNSSIEFSKVVLSTEKVAEEKLMLLRGWAPVDKVSSLEEFLRESGVYYEVSDPLPEDNDEVPIRFNNDWFSRLFEPICRLYMLPKYNELDLTPFFAPFFMIYFGLCLGDIGYGLFFLVAATVYRLVTKNISMTVKGLLTLVQILGASTMICGLLSGGFFGFNIYNLDVPFLKKLQAAISLDNQQMFNLSLIFGCIQIIFGMCLKAVNITIQTGFKYAISTIGWVVLLVSMAVAYLFPSLYTMMSTTHLIIMGIAGAAIFLYNSPGKNIFLNIGLGVWDSYNMATGLLGDVLSYVRLFALGLSGGILASVFDELAIGMKPDNAIAGPIVMVLIFVIGHALNIFMSALGAFVHPVRLTFVEFFKNSGYTGGGKDYKPFKKEAVVNQ